MKHQQHAPPDWLMEFSLAVFIVAILIMGGISVFKRLRRGAPKVTSPRAKPGKRSQRRRRRH